MYKEAFQKLDLEDIAAILEKVNPKLEGVPFDPVETTAMAWDIPFYPGYRLIELADHTSMPVIKRFVIYKEDHQIIIDWKNETIYSLNQSCPIQLDEDNIIDYTIFFFTYVRGKHGRFLIVENVDDISWKEEPPPNARKAIGDMIDPVSLIEKDAKGVYHLKACMMFKDSLFKCDVDVQSDGKVIMQNEELLIEDIPVLDDVIGQ